MKEGNLNGHCPGPQIHIDLQRQRQGEGVTSRDIRRHDGSPSEQKYPTPRQQLLEADKRRRRRLAALARDHIMKLREERDRMAYDWAEEYATRASSAK